MTLRTITSIKSLKHNMHHRRKLRIYTDLTLRRHVGHHVSLRYVSFYRRTARMERGRTATQHSGSRDSPSFLFSHPFPFVRVVVLRRTEIRVDGSLTELASKHARTSVSTFTTHFTYDNCTIDPLTFEKISVFDRSDIFRRLLGLISL